MVNPMLWLSAIAVSMLITLWAIQLRTKDAATIDVAWTILVAGGAIAAGLLAEGDVWRRVLVATLASVWAVRLGAYLLVNRVLSSTVEDGRYLALRQQWGNRAARNFLMLYLFQLVIAGIFVVPIAAAMRGGALDGWAVLGAGLWGVAVAGETVSDRQLARFRADSEGRGTVCRVGLWRYSRHPNYFFEWIHWWAYVIIGHAAPLTFIGPVVMLLFLFRVTGIPYTERQALRTRGAAYRAYQATTSVFVPWPPRTHVR